jgi:HK97 family phage prohead protease
VQRIEDYHLRGCMNPAATAARLAHRRAKPTGHSYEARHLRGTEFRAAVSGDPLTLVGYASVFDRNYEVYGGVDAGGWSEVIDRGAFTKTLAANPDVHLLINHDGLPLARTRSGTLHLSADSKGVKVLAQLDRSDPDVQRLEPKMLRGDINEMSFAFRVKGQVWLDDDAVRRITEVDIDKGDVSVVNFGANPATSAQLAGVR